MTIEDFHIAPNPSLNPVIAQGDIKAKDGKIWVDGVTFALFQAIRDGNVLKVKECLESGADINAVLPLNQTDAIGDFWLDTPLTAALSDLREGNDPVRREIVHLLLAHNPDVSHQQAQGKTALFFACLRGWEYESSMILDRLPDAQRQSHINLSCDGVSCLQAAAILGNIAVIGLLLNYGADKDFTSQIEGLGKVSAQQVARKSGHYGAAETIRNFQNNIQNIQNEIAL